MAWEMTSQDGLREFMGLDGNGIAMGTSMSKLDACGPGSCVGLQAGPVSDEGLDPEIWQGPAFYYACYTTAKTATPLLPGYSNAKTPSDDGTDTIQFGRDSRAAGARCSNHFDGEEGPPFGGVSFRVSSVKKPKNPKNLSRTWIDCQSPSRMGWKRVMGSLTGSNGVGTSFQSMKSTMYETTTEPRQHPVPSLTRWPCSYM